MFGSGPDRISRLVSICGGDETRPGHRAIHETPIDRSARLALLVFVAVVVIAFPVLGEARTLPVVLP
jgi:hypothetical protein